MARTKACHDNRFSDRPVVSYQFVRDRQAPHLFLNVLFVMLIKRESDGMFSCERLTIVSVQRTGSGQAIGSVKLVTE